MHTHNHAHDKDFVHLHLHTEYSLLDGFAQIKEVVSRAVDLNMQALAITDHGTMFGVIDFYRACKAAGIKPIIGVEAYLARRSMRDRDPMKDRTPYHLLLLAKNEAGYKNLLKIASASQLDGYYYRPRIDKEFLAAHADGIVATSGCLAAEIPRMVEEGRDDEALQTIGWYQDVFGKDNFFLELQQHDISELERLNKWLLENRHHANVPLVATNDVHYVNQDDYDVHDTLLCIQTSSLKRESKANRLAMTDPSYHLRSQHEMWQIFGDVAPEALYHTRLIAEMCDIHELDGDGYHLPIFPVPERFDNPEQYLSYLCERGIEWRYGSRASSKPIQDRLEHELNIIFKMGFATYFLIVWDLIEFARSADIWWNVRGSGAGSVVAYSLGITSLDPLENALIFERFLNPHRKTMPDFDLDFPEDRRQEMIEYCARKYGEDKVAAIITFGTLKPKAAIRDVGRALDLPLPEVNRIAKMVPTVAKPPSIDQLLGKDESKPDAVNPEMVELYEKDRFARDVLNYAARVEGVPRHAGTHAAGIIVSDKPLVEYLPLHRPTGSSAEDAPVKQITQFPMETAESIGLLKIDFLGLSTLTIMRRACELIEQHHGIKYDMSNIPYQPDPENPETTRMVGEMFEMMGRGETIGVFQLESSGMRQMLLGMRPKTFEHIIAAISLYRPGPMQFIPQFNARLHGQETVQYLHEKLEPIISNTYGIITYQEQIMQIAMDLFGYDAGEADLMRRAVSKKKEKDLAKHRAIFLERGPQNGVDKEAAGKIFDEIEYFANYGFNKCVVGSTDIIDPQTGRLVKVSDLASRKVRLSQTLTMDTDNLRLKVGQITDVMENGIKPVFRLTTQTGRQIEATANHPFYAFSGWRLLGELEVGERVAVMSQPDDDLEAGDLHVYVDNNVYWDHIASIEYAGKQPTYDLTIAETHNFVANDFIVHNSHAADYAVITCQTAFLKCHYPHEYMTALMSIHKDDTDKISIFVADAKRMSIDILPPNINKSWSDFDIEADDNGQRHIRFGLGAIKNLGLGAVDYIIGERETSGLFKNLDDFLDRCSASDIGKRGLESAIKVGAFDEFGDRPTLLHNIDKLVKHSVERHKAAEVGQVSMFDILSGSGSDNSATSIVNVLEAPPNPADKREQLRWEKDLVGMYVTDHPLEMIMDKLDKIITHNSHEIREAGAALNGRDVTIAGLVMGIRNIITKNGDSMAILQVEDIGGKIECVMFPRIWGTFRDLVEEDRVLVIRGKAEDRQSEMQIIVDSVSQNFDVAYSEELDELRQPNFTWLPQDDSDPVNNPFFEDIPAYIDDGLDDDEDDDDVENEDIIDDEPLVADSDSVEIEDLESPPEAVAEAVAVPADPVPEEMEDELVQDIEVIVTEEDDYLPPPSDDEVYEPVDDYESYTTEQPVNGHDSLVDADGRLIAPPAPAAVPRKVTTRQQLVVTLYRSGDDERDYRLLRWIYSAAMAYPGGDELRVYAQFPDQEDKLTMDFPDLTILVCDALINKLKERLGENCVVIRDL